MLQRYTGMSGWCQIPHPDGWMDGCGGWMEDKMSSSGSRAEGQVRHWQMDWKAAGTRSWDPEWAMPRVEPRGWEPRFQKLLLLYDPGTGVNRKQLLCVGRDKTALCKRYVIQGMRGTSFGRTNRFLRQPHITVLFLICPSGQLYTHHTIWIGIDT